MTVLKNIQTKSDYQEYQKIVEEFFESERINSLSLADGESEPHFSWTACECCKRPLGGDRFDCKGYSNKDNEIYDYAVCVDCFYYAEYGTLDDMTMLKIEEGAEALFEYLEGYLNNRKDL